VDAAEEEPPPQAEEEGMTHDEAWLRQLVGSANDMHGMGAAYDVWLLLLDAIDLEWPDDMLVAHAHALAVQMNWNQGRTALATKRRHLRRSPFTERTRRAAEARWADEAASKPPPRGLGRFRGFNQTWTQITGHRRLLALLQCMADPEVDDARALEEMERYALDPTTPFKPAARFSECLHLSCPSLFPVVNTEQVLAAAVISDVGQYYDAHRFDYLDMRQPLLDFMRGFELRDTVALDAFLIMFSDHLVYLAEEGRTDDGFALAEYAWSLIDIPEGRGPLSIDPDPHAEVQP